MNQKTTSNL